MAGPLDGIRVFDWTLYGVGPFASMLLGSLGAEVIKVEGPGGDPQFKIPPTVNGAAALYINFNLNKKNISVDFTRPRDRELALKLLSGCDVFLNNMRTGTPERFGLGYEEVHRRNPRIVYCVCTGFGRTGPMAGMGGADPMVQAFCGWCSINGQPGGRGEFLRQVHHIDMNASITIVAAVLEALYARERTGRGCFLDMNMLATAVAKQRTRLAEFFATGRQPLPEGSACVTAVPHQAFRCQDGEYLAVGVEEDSQWRALCRALGETGLLEEQRLATNPGRVQHRAEVVSRLQRVLETKPVAWWLHVLRRHHVPCSALWDFDRLRYHPQVVRNHFMPVVRTPWGPVYTGGVPWDFSVTPARMEAGSRPGEDTQAIVGSLETAPVMDPPPAPRDGAWHTDGPLRGLLVVELCQGFAGPYCGQMLADAGAEVLKVEPEEGDWSRRLGPPFQGGQSAVFLSLNRNKESVVCQGVKGRRALERLLERADVVLVDFADTLGRRSPYSYRRIARSNPQVVYCSFSAFGERGPLRDQPASELVVQFMTEITTGLGRIGEPPVRLGADAVTMSAGLYGYHGVLAALLHRRRKGQGQRIGVSLLGSMLNLKGLWWVCQTSPDQWLPPHLSNWTDPPNHGFLTRTLPVSMGFPRYTREDLVAIFTDLGEDPRDAHAIWDALSDWQRRASGEANVIWQRVFAPRTAEEIIAAFARHRGEIIPVNNYPSLTAHPQAKALGIFQEMSHPKAGRVTMIGPAWTYVGRDWHALRTPPPSLGEHTDEVLERFLAQGQNGR